MAKKGGTRDGSKSKAIAAAYKANPTASAKEVIEAVAKSGIKVSVGLVNKVKGELGLTGGGRKKGAVKKKKAKKATVKAAGKKKATKKKASKKKAARRGRPAGGGVNKSEVIRAYIAANPNDGPTAVFRALESQGIKKELVNSVYYKQPKKGGAKPAKKRGPGRPKKSGAPAAAKSSGTSGLSAQQLLDAKDLAVKFGGIGNVRAALDLIEKLA